MKENVYNKSFCLLHCRQTSMKYNHNEKEQAVTQDSTDTTEHKASIAYK